MIEETKKPPLIAVAGSTGWLGNHVVKCLLERGYAVRALVRPATTPPGTALSSQLYQVHRGDVTDAESLQGLATDAVAVISCVGMRDLAVPDDAIYAALSDGTTNLWKEAVRARAKTFVTIGGGIHRTPSGQVNLEMIHNAAREAALDVIQQQIQTASNGRNTHLPSVVVVDGSAFFKDVKPIFDMIFTTDPPSLRLVAGSWTIPFNPISGRDLAARLVDGCDIEASLTGDATERPLPTFTRRTAGGVDIVTFAELADAAGKAMGYEDPVRKKSVPQTVTWLLMVLTKVLAALGSTRANKARHFLSFLWVVGTDANPTGLVGEIDGSRDGVLSYFQDLAKEKGEATATGADT